MIALVALLSLCSLASTARAQTDEERARALFERGLQAAADNRADEARTLLRESLAIYATPAAAYNLALVYRGARDSAEAFRLAEGLLAGSYGPLDDARRQAAATLRDETRREVAFVTIGIRGATGAEISIDDRGVETAGPHAVNPGAHVIRAEAPDGRAVERRLEVAPGDQRQVELAFASPPITQRGRRASPLGPSPRDGEAEESSSIFASPWLWIGVGAVVIGVVAVVLLTSSGDDLPDWYLGRAETLRLPD